MFTFLVSDYKESLLNGQVYIRMFLIKTEAIYFLGTAQARSFSLCAGLVTVNNHGATKATTKPNRALRIRCQTIFMAGPIFMTIGPKSALKESKSVKSTIIPRIPLKTRPLLRSLSVVPPAQSLLPIP